ncbi:MAG: hypothetical protein M1561_05235 [Gammaproteobacteria bacterium]|nr:hypothetical protein [Gammaproteobacteria bacterium]
MTDLTGKQPEKKPESKDKAQTARKRKFEASAPVAPLSASSSAATASHSGLATTTTTALKLTPEEIAKIKAAAKAHFSYKQLAALADTMQKLILDDNKIFAAYYEARTEFIKFSPLHYLAYPQSVADGKNNFGFKLHLAIDDSDRTNLANGWDIIMPILIDYEVSISKVVKPGQNFSSDPSSTGSQLTLYFFATPKRPWVEIITKITEALRKANIKPSSHTAAVRPINEFFAYRNDKVPSSRSYLAQAEAIRIATELKAEAYNPYQEEDTIEPIVKELSEAIRTTPQPEISNAIAST